MTYNYLIYLFFSGFSRFLQKVANICLLKNMKTHARVKNQRNYTLNGCPLIWWWSPFWDQKGNAWPCPCTDGWNISRKNYRSEQEAQSKKDENRRWMNISMNYFSVCAMLFCCHDGFFHGQEMRAAILSRVAPNFSTRAAALPWLLIFRVRAFRTRQEYLSWKLLMRMFNDLVKWHFWPRAIAVLGMCLLLGGFFPNKLKFALKYLVL